MTSQINFADDIAPLSSTHNDAQDKIGNLPTHFRANTRPQTNTKEKSYELTPEPEAVPKRTL